ncbi:MAG: hypothetical protein LBT95_05360 [Treponema sp.]|nr:hypothetical protein [Treponema sp.]
MRFDEIGAVWEFYSPFAHVPGRYEWCRIHSPTHGSFDAFILLAESTALPPWVYLSAEEGLRFMADRYPESRTFRAAELRIESSPDGCVVRGLLRAGGGPVSFAEMRLAADCRDIPRMAPYGGGEAAVWGSRWSCAGVDLVRDGRCDGSIRFAPDAGFTGEILSAAPCLVSAGSFGMIKERSAKPSG